MGYPVVDPNTGQIVDSDTGEPWGGGPSSPAGTITPGGEATKAPTVHWQNGIPIGTIENPPGSGNWQVSVMPSGYAPGSAQPNVGGVMDWTKNALQSILHGKTPGALPSLINQTSPSMPIYDYPWLGSGGGSGARYALEYDPFSQQLQAAQLQELIRQGNLTAGMERAKYLQDTLATPANVFSSFFTARGQVPPYNAQLANILNIPGQNQPFFGSLPDMGQTPLPPNIPQPQPPQPIPYARGGTYMPAEPAVAIGLKSGNPLFTFNENAPQQTEKVKITPQVPSFAEGGTINSIPSGPYGSTPLPPIPAPVQDLYNRDFPQFPYLTNLSQGQGLGMPQLGNSMYGFPVPSMQSINRMLPSEYQSMFSPGGFYDTVMGIPGADVSWAAQYPFRNLRSATPALQRLQ